MATPIESNTEALQTLLEAINSLPSADIAGDIEAIRDDLRIVEEEYFNANTGGSIGGDVNVNGVFRVQGAQMIYYDEAGTKAQTFGTNNATGGTTICCGSSAAVTLNGASAKAPTILPRATNKFTLGDSSLRWSGIYSTTAVNVSSDKRVKRDINELDDAVLADFINGLNVVSYNYKDDPEDEKARIGLIAQEVQAVNPEISEFIVREDDMGKLYLRPADLVFPLISAVQQLTKRVAELEAKLG